MAEYIDRENVESLIEVAIEDNWDSDYTLERLKEINSADVIECAKINKAIVEIKELYTEWENSTDDARLESNPFGAVLNIIQRNIGE